MEIKYEAVFGDQSLFDSAEPDVFLVETDGVYKTFHKETTGKVSIWTRRGCDLAMRRIIRTPTWTVADQKEGKLPPIGSKYLAGGKKEEFTCLFHGKGNGEVCVVGFNSDDEVTWYQAQYCYPIESPEEKAARLRKEWVMNATFMNTYEIYDALLCGDLPVPVKGE